MPLDKLFSPITINGMQLKNRVVLPPITMNFAENGAASDRDIAYHVARVDGGCGLNIIDGALVESNSYGFRLAIDDNRFIEPFARLAKAVHDHGGKVGVQLLHHGRCAPPGLGISKERIVCVVPGFTPDDESQVMTLDDIAAMKQRFVDAAIRAKKAGMDLVELSAGHGYLLAQFMSPLTNRRTDIYGGSFENRMRFPLEVIDAVRTAVGPDYPLSIRMSVDEMIEGGLVLEDSVEIAKQFVAHGIDMISISASLRETYEWCMPPACIRSCWLAEKAAAIRKSIGNAVPVMVSGRILTCEQGEEILEKGQADLVGMGRAQIIEPNLVKHAMEGHPEKSLPCLGCNVGCVDNLNKHLAVSCAGNPLAGNESKFPCVPAARKKKVVIVGSGPAGMQAAITASQRDHDVILMEKEPEIGGRLDVVAIPPFKQTYAVYRQRMAERVRALSIDIRTGCEATVESVLACRPDVVLLATGSVPLIPRFCAEADAIPAEQALRNPAEVGEKVLVLGGGAVGAETAEFLAEKGHHVSIIEMRDNLAADLEWRCRKFLCQRMEKLPVEQLLGHKILSIKGKVVTVETPDGSQKIINDADTVILAIGYRANDPLGEGLEKAGADVRRIGDCEKAGLVYKATHQALETAYEL